MKSLVILVALAASAALAAPPKVRAPVARPSIAMTDRGIVKQAPTPSSIAMTDRGVTATPAAQPSK